jgi:hypothetical protein
MAAMKRRLWAAIAYGTLILAAGLVITIAYMALYPYKVITFGEFRISPTTVKQGGTLAYEVAYTKYMAVEAQEQRIFMDGLLFDAGTFPGNLPVGSGVSFKQATVPESLPAGTYRLMVIHRYKVNPLGRTVEVKAVSNPFTVVINAHQDAAEDKAAQ